MLIFLMLTGVKRDTIKSYKIYCVCWESLKMSTKELSKYVDAIIFDVVDKFGY